MVEAEDSVIMLFVCLQKHPPQAYHQPQNVCRLSTRPCFILEADIPRRAKCVLVSKKFSPSRFLPAKLSAQYKSGVRV